MLFNKPFVHVSTVYGEWLTFGASLKWPLQEVQLPHWHHDFSPGKHALELDARHLSSCITAQQKAHMSEKSLTVENAEMQLIRMFFLLLIFDDSEWHRPVTKYLAVKTGFELKIFFFFFFELQHHLPFSFRLEISRRWKRSAEEDEFPTDSLPRSGLCSLPQSHCLLGVEENILLMTWILDECASVCECEIVLHAYREVQYSGRTCSFKSASVSMIAPVAFHNSTHTNEYLVCGSVDMLNRPLTSPPPFSLSLLHQSLKLSHCSWQSWTN